MRALNLNQYLQKRAINLVRKRNLDKFANCNVNSQPQMMTKYLQNVSANVLLPNANNINVHMLWSSPNLLNNSLYADAFKDVR
jgi:hypothetical protein